MCKGVMSDGKFGNGLEELMGGGEGFRKDLAC